MFTSNGIETSFIDFDVITRGTSEDKIEHKVTILHIASQIKKECSIQHIAERSLTTETLTSSSPLFITSICSSEVNLAIQNVVERSLAPEPLTKPISTSEWFLGGLLSLVNKTHSLPNKENLSSLELDFSIREKSPETLLAIVDIIEQNASKFPGSNFSALSLHAKEAKEWSSDLLKGTKNIQELLEKITSRPVGQPLSLLLGFFRKSGFCPLILVIKKESASYLLEWFCVDEAKKDKNAVHRSWKIPSAEILGYCLEEAISFAKKPMPEHFALDLLPTNSLLRAGINVFTSNTQVENTTGSAEEEHDPADLLLKAFISFGAEQETVGPLAKTDRFARVIKHWQREVLVADPKEEALFKASLQLCLMMALVKEIQVEKIPAHDKWIRLSKIETEMLSLRVKIKKDLHDPIFSSALIKATFDLKKVRHSAFQAIAEEMNTPLKTRAMPEAHLYTASKSPSINSNIELENLRKFRREITPENFIQILSNYNATILILAESESWSSLSNSITTLFILLPTRSDKFWDTLLSSQIQKVSSHLVSLSQLLFEAEIQMRNEASCTTVIEELFKVTEILNYLHFCHIEYVCKEIFLPAIRSKVSSGELNQTLTDSRGILEKGLRHCLGIRMATTIFRYESLILTLEGSNPSSERFRTTFTHLAKITEENYINSLIQHANFCRRLGISLEYCLDLVTPAFSLPLNLRSIAEPRLTHSYTVPSPLHLGEGECVNQLTFKSLAAQSPTHKEIFSHTFSLVAGWFKEQYMPIKEEVTPKTYEALLRSKTLLRMLSGSGYYTPSTPLPETLIKSIKQDMTTSGYRELISDSEVQILAKKHHSLNELRGHRISLTWSSLIAGGRLLLNNVKWTPQQNISVFNTSFTYEKQKTAPSSTHDMLGRAGLKGELPADFLMCSLGIANTSDMYTPQAVAEMELESPTFENISSSTCIALRNLVSADGIVDIQFLHSFLNEHKEYLEIEVIQRRFEYALVRNQVASLNAREDLITWALNDKRYKTASFLLSLKDSYAQPTIDFYQNRLSSASNPKDLKYFGTHILKLLVNASNPWTKEEWILALSAYLSLNSCAENSGNPDLQAQLLIRMKEEFIPLLKTHSDRNSILSSLLPNNQNVEWVANGDNWKVKDQSVFFISSSGILVFDESKGPLPEQILLHSDYKQLFSKEKPLSTVKIKEGYPIYTFDSYSVGLVEGNLKITKKIDQIDHTWQKLFFQTHSSDNCLQFLENLGVWINPANPLQGRIITKKTQLILYFKQDKQGIKFLDRITNQDGHSLVLMDAPLSLASFGIPESTLIFAENNSRNPSHQKIQEIIFLDLDESIKRKGESFFWGRLEVVLSPNLLEYALEMTTSRFPSYGLLCSDEEKLQLQLFFSLKRKTNRPLVIHIEEPSFLGATSEISGSSMGFLFLSLQTAEEGFFEKAVIHIKKAIYSTHPQEEDIDFDWFLDSLEHFIATSLPAKVWKLKCLIAVMQISQDKLQRPVYQEKYPVESLQRPHKAILLWKEIIEALDPSKNPKAKRKEIRLEGILTITAEEVAFLESLSHKSLAHFLSKAKKPLIQNTNPDSIIPPILTPSDYSLLLQKPTAKSILSLSSYPTLKELMTGFSSFAYELTSSIDTSINRPLIHLKSLNIDSMHPYNQLTAKMLFKTLLAISELPLDKKVKLRTDLTELIVDLEPLNRAQQFQELFPEERTENAPEAHPENEEKTSLVKKLESSSLTREEKLTWKNLLNKQDPSIELTDFLQTTLSIKDSLSSKHWVLQIEQELSITKPRIIQPVSAICLRTTPESFSLEPFFLNKTAGELDSTLDFELKNTIEKEPDLDEEYCMVNEQEDVDWLLCSTKSKAKIHEESTFFSQKTGNSPLDLELERIKNTKVKQRAHLSLKDKQGFLDACNRAQRALIARIQEELSVLGTFNPKDREYSDIERFEKIIDRFILENHLQDDQITSILNALIVLKQLNKGTWEDLSAAFNPRRLDDLSPRIARAVLVGEYRSGNVSRPFQPTLIQKLVNDENVAILSPPGTGKTTVIFPLVAQVISSEQGKFPIILLTEELFHIGKEGFDARTKRLFQQAGHVFSFDRNSPKDVVLLAQEVDRISKAKENRDYIITTVGRLAALENEILLKMDERVKRPSLELLEQILWLKRLWGLLHTDDVRFIADEIDELYRPNLDFNYALGSSLPIDPLIRKSCQEVLDLLLHANTPLKSPNLYALCQAIKEERQATLPSQVRLEAIKELATQISQEKFGTDYSEFLTDFTVEKPKNLKASEEVAHLRHLLAITLRSMPISIHSQFGSSKTGITVVPKIHGAESFGTRYSDSYDLTLVHYLYYSVKILNEDYLNVFWMNNESIFQKKEVSCPWTSWAIWWKTTLEKLPAAERYKELNARLNQKESLDERLYIINQDILEDKITLYTSQIRSNAHEILHGCRVCGASGTINPDALGSSFTKDPSLFQKDLMRDTLALIDLDMPLARIKTANEFFIQKVKNPNVAAIIDQAGLQKDRNSLTIAKALREASRKTRQILFTHPQDRKQWMWNPEEDAPRLFRVSERQDSCLCYYGEADCRGTDWNLPKGEFSMIVGPTCSDDDFLQAYGRARRAGLDQYVTIAVEEDFMKEVLTAKDLILELIKKSSTERASANLKALLRNQKAIVSGAIRRSLFDPKNNKDTELFSETRSRLVYERTSNWKSKMGARQNISTVQFLEDSIKAEKTFVTSLPIDASIKEGVMVMLDRFKVSTQDLSWLPETILLLGLETGNTETVQEQALTKEQVVEEQVQQIVSKFSIQENKEYRTEHDTRKQRYIQILKCFIVDGEPNLPPISELFTKCYACKSALEQLKMLTDSKGLQGKSALMWCASKSPQGSWSFLLIDPLHRDLLLDPLHSDVWSTIPRHIIRPHMDNALPSETPFSLENINCEPLDLKDSTFWEAFVEAKILSGCQSFTKEEEIKALQVYLKKSAKRIGSLEPIAKLSLKHRFGSLAGNDNPGWESSSLNRFIQESRL